MPTERTESTTPEPGQASETSSTEPEKQQPEAPGNIAAGTEDTKQRDPVRRMTIIVLCVIIVLFVWYVGADRYAPWTDEARVQGFVVPMVAEVSGRVLEINVETDQIVETGQPLLQIDPRNYDIAVRQAQASLDTAGQQVGASAAGVKSAAAKVSDNHARLRNAQQDFDRVENIFKQDAGAVSKAQRVNAREALAQAKAQLSQAEAELERAKAQLGKEGGDNPALKAAIAALERSKIDLNRTTIYAPGLGLITNLKIDEGHYANAGTPLMTFVSGTDVWIQANMRENSLGHVKPGNEVDIVLDVAPGRIFKGVVKSIGVGISQGPSESLGQLQTIKTTSGWLRDAQRFAVIIDFADNEAIGFRRVGGQADVQIYAGDNTILNGLGWLWIRFLSILSFVY
ncbi:MAG: HlyD family efflux transporter periplasmic adaptor subunit [Gammaproteobacteria bacterium]|jgi:multidrug resistance efflux pump|nr:HlyD family efflux transporter periplasmic adaptor subunit [Gammaproteobacteria bacterium]